MMQQQPQQQSPVCQTPLESADPVSPPSSGSSDRSAAHILLQLNQNYMRMDDSACKDSAASAPAASAAVQSMTPQQPQPQPQLQLQQVQPKKPLPSGGAFVGSSNGQGTINFEPISTAYVTPASTSVTANGGDGKARVGPVKVNITRIATVGKNQMQQILVRPTATADNKAAAAAGQSSSTTSTVSASYKRAARDPSSHRESEKRRRERFNSSLNDLRELVPKSFVSKSCQNKVRLEKTEVINSAIAFIKHLKSNAEAAKANNRPPANSFQLVLKENLKNKCANLGFIFNEDSLLPENLISGGQSILARPTRVGGGEQQPQQPQKEFPSASELLLDLSNGGDGGRARHSSCASSSTGSGYSVEELSPYSSQAQVGSRVDESGSSSSGSSSFISGHSLQQMQMAAMFSSGIESCPISPIVPVGGAGAPKIFYCMPQMSHHQPKMPQQQQQLIKVESGEDSGISVSDHLFPMTPVSSVTSSTSSNHNNSNGSNIVSPASGYNFISL